MTDDQIIAIRDAHLPAQGEPFDCIAFARAVLDAQPRSIVEQRARDYAQACLLLKSEDTLDELLDALLRAYTEDNARRAIARQLAARRLREAKEQRDA